MTILYIVLGIAVLGVIAGWIWRRDALPCPTWLSWMVEMDNPFTEVNRARVIVGPLDLAHVGQKVEAAGLQNVKFLQAGLGAGKLSQAYFDRALLVTVLGEIPDEEAALKEIYHALKPGGILSVTEVIFDPHFQRREAVLKIAGAAGFKEKSFFGRKLAYTIHLEK